MQDDALWRMTAADQAAAVRGGQVSAAKLTDSHLARIEAVNPRVNAVTQLWADRAREEAARLDRRRAAGEELGPLAGVPFTVKESTPSKASPPPSAPSASATWWPAPTRCPWPGCGPPGRSPSGTATSRP